MSEIDEYIAANRERYTRDALTRQLLDAGHDGGDIEAAWRRADATPASAADSASRDGAARAGRPGPGTILLIVLAIAGYAFVGYFGVVGILFSAYYGGGEPGPPVNSIVPGVLVAVYVVGMLAGLVYSGRRLVRAASLPEGAGAIATAFGITVAVLFGINGACIAGTIAAGAVGALR